MHERIRQFTFKSCVISCQKKSQFLVAPPRRQPALLFLAPVPAAAHVGVGRSRAETGPDETAARARCVEIRKGAGCTFTAWPRPPKRGLGSALAKVNGEWETQQLSAGCWGRVTSVESHQWRQLNPLALCAQGGGWSYGVLAKFLLG